LLRQPWFFILHLIPISLLIGSVIWRRHQDAVAGDPRLRRRRQTAQTIRSGLGELRRLAAENNSDAFFAILVRLLQEKLGERLDVPASSITESVVEEHLRPRETPENTLHALHDLFQTCNLVRYAPIKSSQELDAFISRLEAVLDVLDEVGS
jgi:hypothetical protein